LSIVRISTNQKTTFRKLDLFPSSGEGGGTYSTEKPKACLSTGDDKVQKLSSNGKKGSRFKRLAYFGDQRIHRRPVLKWGIKEISLKDAV
jgi:hypothetical protein